MRSSQVASLVAAAAMSTSLWLVGAPSAFATQRDCVKEAVAGGVPAASAQSACSEAAGGDAEDCEFMVRHDSTAAMNDEDARDTCGQAVPPAHS